MSKGSKRNKDSDFEDGDNSDDDFEKDFKNKKNKKNRTDPGSADKKIRERRSTRVDPLDNDIKKAIELSLKENSTNANKTDINEMIANEEENAKKEKNENVNEHEQTEVKAHIESCDKKSDETDEKLKKKNNQKKPKKMESEEEDIEAEESDDDFKKSKPKKRTPPKKKPTPNSNSKKKNKKSDENSTVLNEIDSNKEVKLNNEKEKETCEKVVVSLKFDEPKEEPKITVPNLSSSRKSLSSIETKKSELKNLNTSLNLNPSPLGRIEIKASQPQYRVGLSRNSKVKPLHPNVKLT